LDEALPILRLYAKTLSPDASALLLQAADKAAAKDGYSQVGEAEARSVFESLGLTGLRKLAVSKGYYLPERGLPSGLYKITQIRDAALLVLPLVVLDSSRLQNVISIDAIGEQYFLIATDTPYPEPELVDDAYAVMRQQLSGGTWGQQLQQLAKMAAREIPYIRKDECRNQRSLRQQVTEDLGKGIAKFNAQGGWRKDESAGLVVNRLMESLLADGACPFAVLHALGRGAYPGWYFDNAPAFSAARIAFSGMLADKCSNSSGRIDVDSLAECEFLYLTETKPDQLAKDLRSLARNTDNWNASKVVIAGFAENLISDQRKDFAKDVMAIGIQVPKWLDLLGYRMSDLPTKFKAHVEVGSFVGGEYRTRSFDETIDGLRGKSFPIITAQIRTAGFNNCSLPVYWNDEWWRVCISE
jgi:hypothetical protein